MSRFHRLLSRTSHIHVIPTTTEEEEEEEDVDDLANSPSTDAAEDDRSYVHTAPKTPSTLTITIDTEKQNSGNIRDSCVANHTTHEHQSTFDNKLDKQTTHSGMRSVKLDADRRFSMSFCSKTDDEKLQELARKETNDTKYTSMFAMKTRSTPRDVMENMKKIAEAQIFQLTALGKEALSRRSGSLPVNYKQDEQTHNDRNGHHRSSTRRANSGVANKTGVPRHMVERAKRHSVSGQMVSMLEKRMATSSTADHMEMQNYRHSLKCDN